MAKRRKYVLFFFFLMFLFFQEIEDKAQMVPVVRSLVNKLPMHNKYLLQYLMSFLVKVANKGKILPPKKI